MPDRLKRVCQLLKEHHMFAVGRVACPAFGEIDGIVEKASFATGMTKGVHPINGASLHFLSNFHRDVDSVKRGTNIQKSVQKTVLTTVSAFMRIMGET